MSKKITTGQSIVAFILSIIVAGIIIFFVAMAVSCTPAKPGMVGYGEGGFSGKIIKGKPRRVAH